MSWKNAFNCQKCPRSSDPEVEFACPAWIELVEASTDGERRVTKGCQFMIMPRLIVQLSAKQWELHAQMVQDRNDISREIHASQAQLFFSITRGGGAYEPGTARAGSLPGSDPQPPAIADHTGQGCQRSGSAGLRHYSGEANGGLGTGSDVFRQYDRQADLAEGDDPERGVG